MLTSAFSEETAKKHLKNLSVLPMATLKEFPSISYWLVMFLFIHSFIQASSIAPLKVHYYSEVLPTQHRYCTGVLHRSATGNCK